MINQTFPITPPPEALQQWRHQWACCPQNSDPNLGSYIANQASHWGWDQRGAATEAELQKAADQELEACCEWLDRRLFGRDEIAELRAARRKPPSLKEQALSELNLTADPYGAELSRTQFELIRRALEALPND